MKRLPKRRLRARIVTVAMGVICAVTMTADAETLRGRSPQGRGQAISVRVNSPLKARLLQKIRGVERAGLVAESYVNVARHNSVSFKKRGTQENKIAAPAVLVTVVPRAKQEAWAEHIGTKTIGFMATGTPNAPEHTGNMRIGGVFFEYSDTRQDGWGGLQNMASMSEQHVESTFEATPAEIKAFHAFQAGRSTGAIQSRENRPEFLLHGTSTFTNEGCAGASTSVFNGRWQQEFVRTVPAIRAKGRELLANLEAGQEHLRPVYEAMRDADAGMMDTVRAFQTRYGIPNKVRNSGQESTPQALMRNWGWLANGRTVLGYEPATGWGVEDANRARQGNVKTMQFDTRTSNHDGDNSWSGMASRWYPGSLDDRAEGQSGTRSFANQRLSVANTKFQLGNGTPEPEPGQPGGGGTTPAPGAGSYEGVSFTAAQAATTLARVNSAPLNRLDTAYHLDRRAAAGIVAAREAGPLTMERLAAVPYVGRRALERLRNSELD
jgi:hypothetical protein